MSAKDRIRNNDWEVFDEEKIVGSCKCGQGKIIDVYTVASHEKVYRVEKDFDERIVRCENPECPSK